MKRTRIYLRYIFLLTLALVGIISLLCVAGEYEESMSVLVDIALRFSFMSVSFSSFYLFYRIVEKWSKQGKIPLFDKIIKD